MRAQWNHNNHYWPVVLAAVPAGPIDVLDVGCGDGGLARAMAARGARVVALDVDASTLQSAQAAGGGVDYVLGDLLCADLGEAHFDAVVAVAVLHHLDAEAGLTRMRDLLRPGGVLVVVGLARSRRLLDVPIEIAAAVAHRWFVVRRGYREQTAPTVWPPPHSYAEMRQLVRRLLPGAHFRRRLLWRYTVVWTNGRGQPTGARR